MTTKTAFLAAYGAILRKTYPWAEPIKDDVIGDQDNPKFIKFMDVVEKTITPSSDGVYEGRWNFNGPTTDAAWREIGMKGKPTLKALRALMP